MSKVLIESGDAVQWAKDYRGEPFHALLADPPYHLVSIIKRYGKSGPSDANLKLTANQGNSPYERGARGFMGKTWDGGDVAFDPETWAAFLSVMYPGAFGMAFASSRGWHRLAVAIEDGGFVIHPSIFGWAYGSGFPKATRVNHGSQGFEGHRYGLQALKPALEPIIVFQRPYEGRPADNITTTGAGVLNVDGGRIPGPAWTWGTQTDIRGGGYGSKRPSEGDVLAENVESDPAGRWPANFILMDEDAAARLDAQSGDCPVSGSAKNGRPATGDNYGRNNVVFPSGFGNKQGTLHNDSGGASRFFFRVSEQLDEADPVRYCAKASRAERDAGLEGMPVTSKPGVRPNSPDPTGKFPEHDHRAGIQNPHPTVKPLSLAKYLATLLLPPAQYAPRRLFVPFAGVASECIGAMQAGWEEVTGVELTEEYIPIARARIDYWASKPVQIQMELG